MFASLVCLMPSLFIFVAVCLSVFLYFDMMVFCKRFEYSYLLRQCIFDILPALIKVLFDDQISFRYLASILRNLSSTFWNLNLFFYVSHVFIKVGNQTELTTHKTKLTFGLNTTKCPRQVKE